MCTKFCVAVMAACALTGCSYSYELRAIALQGRLAFVVDPASRSKADCIRSISVSSDDDARAVASKGDDSRLVENGVFWWKDFAVDACPNHFPVLYGKPLKGTPFLPPGVGAKPLKIGVIYSVTTSGSGSGYGSGRFRIRPDHTVENIPLHDASTNSTGSANGS